MRHQAIAILAAMGNTRGWASRHVPLALQEHMAMEAHVTLAGTKSTLFPAHIPAAPVVPLSIYQLVEYVWVSLKLPPVVWVTFTSLVLRVALLYLLVSYYVY
jgi:hypothetical protein